MKHIVITGSTRGIGYGLADSFLDLGCAVSISGRSREGVENAVGRISAKHDENDVFGFPCDVIDPEQVKALWDAAKAHFGNIDIWVNNAGVSGPQLKIGEISPSQARIVVETNMLGVIYGSMVAVEGMMEQRMGGIYNMEGMGTDGRMHEGLTLYGMTKYGLDYFTKGLIKETKSTPVLVGSISPGMVITDFILNQYVDRPDEFERAKRIFNIIADRVETVTPWLAERILTNDKHGARFSWFSRRKFFTRVLTNPFRKRNLFEET